MTDPLPSLLAVGDPRLGALSDLARARATVAAATIDDPAVRANRDRILGLVDARADALHRTCAVGHLTGSALVVEEGSGRLLLLFHRKLQRWLQPGGHADGDANLAAVALREATEETGIVGLRVDPDPIDLDVHVVRPPGEPEHEHHDVRFLVVAPAGAAPTINHESEGARWVTRAELDTLDVDPGTRRMAAAGLVRAGLERPSPPVC